MKAKIEMYVEVSKDGAEDYEIISHLRYALTSYAGNEIEFRNSDAEKCYPVLEKFLEEHAGQLLLCLETFMATHTNVIAGELIQFKREFEVGCFYRTECWRPEGMYIDGFFVFHKHAGKFALS